MALRALGNVFKGTKNLSPCKSLAAGFNTSVIVNDKETHTGQVIMVEAKSFDKNLKKNLLKCARY